MRPEDVLDLLDTEFSTLGKRSGRQALPGLSTDDIESLRRAGNTIAALAGTTTDKEYRELQRHANVFSNSINGSLHACPRKLVLDKISANKLKALEIERDPNIDFVFGHSVGAGVQACLAYESLTAGLYAGFISWRADFDFGYQDYYKKRKKTIDRAVLAIEKFWYFRNSELLEDWEIYRLDDGRPGVEISFCIDFGDFKYFGHIDLLLIHKRTRRVAVGELKTSGYTNIDEAVYRNSGQALGYSLIVDSIVGQESDYDVNYMAYSAPSEEWNFFPFAKSTAQKLEWIQDRLIDISHMKQYYKMQHFPKRGESCMQFNRRCQYYGECDLVDKQAMAELPILSSDDKDTYPVDFYFNVQDIIGRQMQGVEL